MKKKIITIIILITLTILLTIWTFSLTNLYSYDEIWNYGFSINILNGLTPYLDFNMVITPLFPYVLSLVLKIFGKSLLVYHIFISVLTVAITYLAYQKIGIKAIIILLLLLIYNTNGYNLFSLFLLFLLLKITEEKFKYKELCIPLIISLMILTKQSLGLLIIPSLIFTKVRKKVVNIYLIIFLSFLIYLIVNNNLFNFINYCFLGMFDFTSQNSFGIGLNVYFILEVFSIIYLLIKLYKYHLKNKTKESIICYILFYQVIAFPIVDISHFVLSVSPVIYLIFMEMNFSKVLNISLFISLLIVVITSLGWNYYINTYRYLSLLNNYQNDGYLKGRLVPEVTSSYISEIETIIKNNSNRTVYILGNYAYLIKLSLNIPINKYDLINNGNMGYQGSYKYIKEISDNCRKNSCLIILNENELKEDIYNQTNKDILNYVIKNYSKVYSSNIYGIYLN